MVQSVNKTYQAHTSTNGSLIVRSIYGKYPLNPQKLLQKVSQLILVGFSVLYNILKVYQSRTPGKVFFSRWRPR